MGLTALVSGGLLHADRESAQRMFLEYRLSPLTGQADHVQDTKAIFTLTTMSSDSEQGCIIPRAGNLRPSDFSIC